MGGNDLHLVAVHGVVIYVVVRSSFTIQQEHTRPRLRNQFRIALLDIQEGLWQFIICGVFRLGHEGVDGATILGFMSNFMVIMEQFDDSDSHSLPTGGDVTAEEMAEEMEGQVLSDATAAE